MKYLSATGFLITGIVIGAAATIVAIMAFYAAVDTWNGDRVFMSHPLTASDR